MFVIIGLLVAFVLIAVFSNRATRLCRWREYPRGTQATWRCVHCGAETEGTAGKPPRSCLRDNTGPGG